jgi:hypothetical protein
MCPPTACALQDGLMPVLLRASCFGLSECVLHFELNRMASTTAGSKTRLWRGAFACANAYHELVKKYPLARFRARLKDYLEPAVNIVPSIHEVVRAARTFLYRTQTLKLLRAAD